MKIFYKIFLILIITSNFHVYGQKFGLLNTKDLVPISEKYGLDSALILVKGFPIYYIDKETSKQLLNYVNKFKTSTIIENFIIDFVSHNSDTSNANIIYNFYKKRLQTIDECKTEYFGNPSTINDKSLLTIIKYADNRTEQLLVDFYEQWYRISFEFKADYVKGMTKNQENKSLIEPFQNCNLNCTKLLLTLQKLNSKYFDTLKIKTHNEFLPTWAKNSSLYDSGAELGYNKGINPIFIKLSKEYNTIGEINFRTENSLNQLFSNYIKSFCWQFVIYNNKLGYLDLGCVSEPDAGYGTIYRIELVSKNELKIVEISEWVS